MVSFCWFPNFSWRLLFVLCMAIWLSSSKPPNLALPVSLANYTCTCSLQLVYAFQTADSANIMPYTIIMGEGLTLTLLYTLYYCIQHYTPLCWWCQSCHTSVPCIYIFCSVDLNAADTGVQLKTTVVAQDRKPGSAEAKRDSQCQCWCVSQCHSVATSSLVLFFFLAICGLV